MIEEGGEYVNGISVDTSAFVFSSIADGITDVARKRVGLGWGEG